MICFCVFSEPPQVPPRNIILKPESVYEEIDQINLQERPIKKANTIDIRNTISQWYDDASDEIERDLSLGEKSILIHYFWSIFVHFNSHFGFVPI